MTNDSPVKVSVIIPCYNVEKYLRECLDSVVNQTLKEIEIICVDDGSTDSTPQILEEYAAKDSRFTILHQKNQFAGVARNNGMKIARGKYLSFLDSDDFFEPTMFEKMVHRAEEVDAEIVVCDYRHFWSTAPEKNWIYRVLDKNENLRTAQFFSPEKTLSALPIYNLSFTTWNKIFKREFVEKTGNTFAKTRSSNDLTFVSFSIYQATRIAILPEILLSYRRDSLGAITASRGKFLETNIVAWLDLKTRMVDHDIYKKFKNSFFASLSGSVAYELKQNPSLEFLEAIYAKFPDIPYSVRASIEQEAFKRTISQRPLVSIVVPVYNAEKYIRPCLERLSQQPLKNIEIICVNDGSTDNSLAIVKEYAKQDSRIKIYSQKNGGEGAAKNAGIRHAEGKYVAILDPDDYVDPDFYEKLSDKALASGTIITKGNVKIVQGDKVSIPAWSLNNNIREYRTKLPLFACFYYQHCTALYDREFLVKNNITFGTHSVGADIIFLLKLGALTDSISIIDDAFHYYVQSETGISRIYNQQYFASNIAYVTEAIEFLNTRGKFDDGYYTFLISRFKQLVNVVFLQLTQSFHENGIKLRFIKQIRALAQKIHGECPQIKAILETLPPAQAFSESTCKMSVIIPVYNTGKYLRECLDSVCKQDLRDIEIVCVNDGSTDNSLAILKEYAQKDPRVKVISQENAGLGAARNVGLSYSNGEFIYFMDSDDVSSSEALSKMYTTLKGSGLDALFFSAASFYETPELEQSHAHYKTYYTRKEFDISNGQTLGVKLQNTKSNFASACCYCCRRLFLIENEIYFPEGSLYEDNAVFWTILKNAQKAKSISTPLFLRRVRQNSIMTNRKLGFRNFEGYAKTISILEKLSSSGKHLSSEFDSVLRTNANAFSGTLVRFYQQISPADRIRSRELLSNELRNSKWLDSVRVNIAKIEGDDIPTKGEVSSPSSRGNPGSLASVSSVEFAPKKRLPRFLVRLGAMFIWNKAARKRWREEHMDLTPRNGIDIHAHPELRRDSALKRLAVRTAALFIFSKSKRKAFRAKHLNLAPRDGVDVASLSPEARRLRKQKKRERNPLRRLFNALVPATRSKLSHAEKRLTRHMEWQTQQLLTALKTSQAQAERRVNEGRLSLKRELENDLSKALKTTLDSLANARREFSEVAQSTATLIKRADCLAQAQKELRTAAIESYSRIEKHTPNSLEFRTFGDLAHCIRKHLHKIPADVDLIVGIPRSGMIPAYTIALFMNKKCCSLDEFLAGCEVSNGYRPLTKTEVRKVLVVDDSCYSGRAIDTARERLAALAGKYEFVYAAVYGRTASLDKVDCCLEIVDGKRVWQWNYLNHSIAQAACFDMDGVLCVDPTPEENDDGPKYLNFIKNTAPLYIPTYKIRAVVTSRLEKYREATEAWLREHGVQYDELVMLNMATAEERRQANCHAKFKAEAYKKRTETTLFVESEDRQAKEIAFLTGKEVLCVTTDELY